MENFDPEKIYSLSMKEYMDPIQAVYIDLPYIQDIYLGGLILSHYNEKDYTYILSKLPEYKSRITFGHAEHFPDLGMTEDQLVEYVTDRSNITNLLMLSPMTSLFLELPNLHKNLQDHNARVSEKPFPIRYLVNVYPLALNEAQMNLLKLRFSVLPDIQFGIIQKPLKNLQDQIFTSTQIWFIEDMSATVDQESNCGKHFTAFTFKDYVVNSPKRIGNSFVLDKLKDLSDQRIQEIFEDSALVANFFTNFYFLNADIKIESSTSE